MLPKFYYHFQVPMSLSCDYSWNATLATQQLESNPTVELTIFSGCPPFSHYCPSRNQGLIGNDQVEDHIRSE